MYHVTHVFQPVVYAPVYAQMARDARGGSARGDRPSSAVCASRALGSLGCNIDACRDFIVTLRLVLVTCVLGIELFAEGHTRVPPNAFDSEAWKALKAANAIQSAVTIACTLGAFDLDFIDDLHTNAALANLCLMAKTKPQANAAKKPPSLQRTYRFNTSLFDLFEEDCARHLSNPKRVLEALILHWLDAGPDARAAMAKKHREKIGASSRDE